MGYATPFNGKERKCPICGKPFLLYEETWVYKRRINSERTKYFCSYGCMNKFDLTRPKAQTIAADQRDKLIQMIREGKGQAEIVRTLGVERSKVRYWMERVAREGDK